MFAVGAGGIGSNLVSPVVKALHSGALLESLGSVRVRLYDSDLVEESNLAHQNFTPDDVGRYKVEAVMQPLLTFQSDKLILEAIAEDVRSPDPILDADIAVLRFIVRITMSRNIDFSELIATTKSNSG